MSDSGAEEIDSEISEDAVSEENYSGSFEGSFKSYHSTEKKEPIKQSKYPPIPGKTPLKVEDDYSFSFEASGSNNNYSQDFEAEDSALQRTAALGRPPMATGVPSRQLPSMEIQAFQAEMSLQHLSTEVIALRNKQRAILKERWSKVKEKKARAEERRIQYQNELNYLKQRVVELESDNKSLNVVNAHQAAELRAAQQTNEALEATSERTLKLSEEKDKEISALNTKVSDLFVIIDALKAEAAAQVAAEVISREHQRSEIVRRELQLEVLTKSMEASEQRIEKMRENLPSYYEQVLKEKLDRVISHEAEMQARLDLQKVDVERQLQQVQLYKKESADEIVRQRARMEIEFSEERQHLDRLRLEYSAQEARLSMKAAEQDARAESTIAEAKRAQAEANESIHMLRREEAELSVRYQMLDPVLTAAEQDREAASSIKREAQNTLTAVEMREASLLQSEAGLRAREIETDKIVAEARIVYNKYFNAKAHTETDLKAIAQQKSAILKERFRMHRCSIELSSQMDLLKHAVREVMRLKKSSADKRSLQITDGRRFLRDENNEHVRNDSEEEEHSSAPLIVHCKALLRDFEDASERMKILSEELQSDPFHVTPLQECPVHVPFNHIMQISGTNTSNGHDVDFGVDLSPKAPSRELLAMCGNKRPTYSDTAFQVFEQRGPAEVRSYVADADASVAALKAAAASYCR